MYIFLSNTSDAVIKTLKDWAFWSAILATIFVIFVGWLLTKKNIFKKDWESVLIKVVMVVGLPALAFDGFMSDTSIEQVKTQIAILLVGFLFYIITGIFIKYFYIKYEKDIRDTLTMCTVFASTTFFGIPIVTALFGNSSAAVPANIFNIPYRVFLYSLGFIVMSKPNTLSTIETGKVINYNKNVQIQTNLKEEIGTPINQNLQLIKRKNITKNLKQIFFNPILIATIVGFIFWVTQLIPGIKVVPDQLKPNSGLLFSPLRLDNTFPPFFKVTKTLEGICTPLAWLAIGITLAKGDIKKALSDKKVWYGTFMKIIFAPLVGLGLTVIFALIGNATGAWHLDKIGLSIIVVMLAAPPASVIVAYSINFKKQPLLTSNLTLVATLFSIVILPFWVIITAAIGSTSLFS